LLLAPAGANRANLGSGIAEAMVWPRSCRASVFDPSPNQTTRVIVAEYERGCCHHPNIQQERAMSKASLARRLGRLLLGASVTALALSQTVRAEDGRDHDAGQNPIEQIRTASPIKHVIIIVGENRSFDHLFATYRPKSDDERVLNLLSERIIKADGSPNENFDSAHQFQITSAPNGGK
jgi:hypothetical protein